VADRSRVRLVWWGLGLVGLIVVWLLARDSAEDRIQARLTQFATAAAVRPDEAPPDRRARIESAVRAIFTADAVVQIPDLDQAATGTAAVARAAAELGAGQDEASLAFEQPNIAVDSAGSEATLNTRVLLSSRSRASGLRTDNREVYARLRKTSDGWQVYQVVVAPHSTVEPEPRP
jgi:ketosteroid isomerase-like protein